MPSAQRPRIRYAQNFLIDPSLVDRLLDLTSVGLNDFVLEIGPGEGIITERLARRARRVLAIERDGVLARRLAARFASQPRIAICAADFLTTPLPNEPYKVVANIPFNRTATIVSTLTRVARSPDDCYLVVQREAAERFLGRPYGTLYAASLAPWFAGSLLHRFERADFMPSPGVDVVLLRLAKRGPPLVAAADRGLYRDFVTALFVARRPNVFATLRRLAPPGRVAQALLLADVPGDARPSELLPERWPALFCAFARVAGRPALRHLAGAEERLQAQQAGLQRSHRTRRHASGPGPPRGVIERRICLLSGDPGQVLGNTERGVIADRWPSPPAPLPCFMGRGVTSPR
jgi:23S rRNA (adenine-N6)-dimethyltransferase